MRDVVAREQLEGAGLDDEGARLVGAGGRAVDYAEGGVLEGEFEGEHCACGAGADYEDVGVLHGGVVWGYVEEMVRVIDGEVSSNGTARQAPRKLWHLDEMLYLPSIM